MQVEFHRTGERRYAVVVKRGGLPPFTKNPAPGFDALLPHDLMHFIVEKELKIPRGIFGQIAEGGTAGTFSQAQEAYSKADTRRRRSTKERGKKLLDAGKADCAQSERATYVCWHDWLSKSANPEHKNRAAGMKVTAQSLLGLMPESERKQLNENFLARMRQRLDELSGKWSALKTGEYMTLEWSP